ncbi:hypothetical protein BZA77DRAFT_306202 [Pyronema omphalodes]|nr:hypothetical protein BZA77DRAFT_306202 [Pyronema omphalodes]
MLMLLTLMLMLLTLMLPTTPFPSTIPPARMMKRMTPTKTLLTMMQLRKTPTPFKKQPMKTRRTLMKLRELKMMEWT